jgi:hypothetical protein
MRIWEKSFNNFSIELLFARFDFDGPYNFPPFFVLKFGRWPSNVIKRCSKRTNYPFL